MAINNDEILSWDAVIEDEGSASSWRPLEPGDYDFTVMGTRRTEINGKPVLEVELDIDGVTVTERLFWTTKAEWKISAFALSIGVKKHGEPLKPDFNDWVTRKGRCKVINEEFKGRDGSDMKSNRVSRYYDREVSPAAPAASAAPKFSL